jgi:hypothetical protein
MKEVEMTQQHTTGGCQCGAIRFQINAPLGKAELCHCRMCQKAFGNFAAALISARLDHVEWTRGKPTTFKSSPIVDRGFCEKCGTPLFMREAGDNTIDLAVGAFDNPAQITFHQQIGVESRLRWFQTLHLLPEAKTADTRPASELARLISLQHPDHD